MELNQQIRELGQRVKDRRYVLDMTHVEVSRESKRRGWPVSQPTLSKIEDRKITTLPGGNILIGLSLALKTSPDDLLGYTPSESLSPIKKMPFDVRKVAEIMMTLTPELQSDILRFAENAKKLAIIRHDQDEMYEKFQNHLYLKDLLNNVTSLSMDQQKAVLDAIRQAGITGDPEGTVKPSIAAEYSPAAQARIIAKLEHSTDSLPV